MFPRKQIAELAVRYQREPHLRDLYVEGNSDRVLLRRVLGNSDVSGVVIYDVDTVEIPPQALQAEDLDDSRRGRVLYLAIELAQTLPATAKAVTCIADRDYDIATGDQIQNPLVLFTEYSCIEMYSFNSSVLQLVLDAIAPNVRKTAEQILADIEGLLRNLFAARATNIILALNLKWLLTFEKSSEMTGGGIQFDEDDFIMRYLNKNAAMRHLDRFKSTLQEVKRRCTGDRRMCIRGHDFSAVLSWYLKKLTNDNSPLCNADVLEHLLLAYVAKDDVLDGSFGTALLARLRS